MLCDIVSKERVYEINDLTEEFLKKAQKWRNELNSYKRCTGHFKEPSVARNHILVAHGLGLVKISGNYVESTSFSALFASLPMNEENPFSLTLYEKLSFFDLLFKEKFDTLAKILQSIYKLSGNRFDYHFLRKHSLDDHTVKSHVEWLIDLDIIIPHKPKEGDFELANINQFKNEISSAKSYTENLLKVYAQFLLNKSVLKSEADDKIIAESFEASFEKTKVYCQSEIDKKVFSALPIIYYCRLHLIVKYGIFINLFDLIKYMEKILPQKNIVFRWDPSYEGGFIKYEG
jgi:hypothetical protein